jgi:phage tail sheath protein FI
MGSGYTSLAYQSKMLEIAEARRDCFCLFDTPKDKVSAENIIDWRKNDQGFTSYRGALSTPWVKTYDSIQGKSGFLMAPSAFLAKIIGTSEPWVAPAGLNRGMITSSVTSPVGLTAYFDETEGGNLYSNQLNCIIKNPGAGYVNWGQKTLQQKSSALDRINVARTVIFIETTLRDAARYQLFENNTAFLRTQITLQFSQFLDRVLAAGGLQKYQVICDDSNNTPYVIANNQLVIDIYLWPTYTAEYIILNTTVMGPDAQVSVSTSNS